MTIRQRSGEVVGGSEMARWRAREQRRCEERDEVRGMVSVGRGPYIVADLTELSNRIGRHPATVSPDSTVRILWRIARKSQRPETDGISTAEE